MIVNLKADTTGKYCEYGFMRKSMKLFFNVAIALGTTVICTPALAFVHKFESDFEQNTPGSEINGKSGWFFTRGAGLDYGKGFSFRGRGNAWVRNTTGWNAINRWINMGHFDEGDNCTASAWLRTSDNLTDGYMSVRDGSKSDGTGKILNEIKLVGPRTGGRGNISGYRQLTSCTILNNRLRINSQAYIQSLINQTR